MNDNIHRRTDRTPDPFYRDKRWKRLRRAMLARAGWMCEECRRYGKRADAEAVHHVFPKSEFPEYQWMAWNLMCLCKTCHDAMHDRITNALTDRGVSVLRRTARRQGVPIPMRYRE